MHGLWKTLLAVLAIFAFLSAASAFSHPLIVSAHAPASSRFLYFN